MSQNQNPAPAQGPLHAKCDDPVWNAYVERFFISMEVLRWRSEHMLLSHRRTTDAGLDGPEDQLDDETREILKLLDSLDDGATQDALPVVDIPSAPLLEDSPVSIAFADPITWRQSEITRDLPSDNRYQNQSPEDCENTITPAVGQGVVRGCGDHERQTLSPQAVVGLSDHTALCSEENIEVPSLQNLQKNAAERAKPLQASSANQVQSAIEVKQYITLTSPKGRNRRTVELVVTPEYKRLHPPKRIRNDEMPSNYCHACKVQVKTDKGEVLIPYTGCKRYDDRMCSKVYCDPCLEFWQPDEYTKVRSYRKSYECMHCREDMPCFGQCNVYVVRNARRNNRGRGSKGLGRRRAESGAMPQADVGHDVTTRDWPSNSNLDSGGIAEGVSPSTIVPIEFSIAGRKRRERNGRGTEVSEEVKRRKQS